MENKKIYFKTTFCFNERLKKKGGRHILGCHLILHYASLLWFAFFFHIDQSKQIVPYL